MKKVSLLIPNELYIEILKVAQSDNRTFSYAAIALLQKGLKEKTRKRGKKEIHPAHNTSN